MTRPRFNRILLKLSGEALMGQGYYISRSIPSAYPVYKRLDCLLAVHYIFDPNALYRIAFLQTIIIPYDNVLTDVDKAARQVT
jgi:hypothetical protein